MIPKRIEDITVADLQALISEGRNEDRTIEYKLSLPSNAESERVPWLLKPICSFANTDGGDLVFGIKANNGIPEPPIVPLVLDSIDQTKLSLEHMIQNGIEPQVRGIHIRDVQIEKNRFVMVLRIPKSWTAPHRVKSNSKFYARNSAGSYELDIPQIKQIFLFSDTLNQRLREFRASRIANIVGDAAPVPLQNGLRVILHIIPITAFAHGEQFSVKEYRDLGLLLRPTDSSTIDYHLNFDGLVVRSGAAPKATSAYAQLFRTGSLEYVDVYEPWEGKKIIPSASYERRLLESYTAGIKVLQKLGVEPPLIILLTLVNAKGFSLSFGQQEQFYLLRSFNPFDRDIMLLPDVQVEAFDQSNIAVLKPLFDIIWNSGGVESSLNFDEQNRWKQRS